MEVRIATPDDARDLFALNTLFGNSTTLECLRKSLAENDRELVCIAFVDGKAAGYCTGLIVKSMCYADSRADLEALYVKEEHRGRGVGEALLLCQEEALAARGVHHFHIVTQKDNHGARALYTKLGYTPAGEILLDKTRTGA